MAQAILGGLGGALAGGVGQAVGAALGRAVDGGLVAALAPARQRGPRLETLKIQSSADGAPMACAYGRARVTGQIIWAARFLERRQASGGGKGGPRTTEYAYSLSFAVALCEGPIDGVGRVWADGQPMNLTDVAMRVHRGLPDQTPDPLIEAVEGHAPAYRNTAYVVFEDLPLGPFGNRPPQLSFEVFRRPLGSGRSLEDRLEGVCLIPGAGEFCLADEPVLRRDGLTRTTPENVNNGEGRPDLLASLDQLEAQCPNLKRVSLVVGWFGDDLRAGRCRVRPGVERRDKLTTPQTWNVAGLDRQGAHLISTADGGPAYGGTPSDESVRQAIRALKARGWEVTLYPFVFMDVPADNALPDPHGGARQAAYPWRGRITGRNGGEAAADVAALFGGPGDWGLRRQALHYAAMAAQEGAAGLLIGSEMRGLTRTRDDSGAYPAVAELKTLAAECRALVGPRVKLSYAADWSEYFGHQPNDGSGDVIFHLDPLWADPNIDYVGIDWYPPLTDWREGDGGLDAEDGARGPWDRDHLRARVAGGEGFDWFYASAADRAAQKRTPIVDAAHGEDWIFRPKDLRSWWSEPHHDRPGGVRSSQPTAWVPAMKPIRLTEFGCAAVDRGGNAPNLFQDPKSAENALPPHSTGARDDRMQRRALEAILAHYETPAHNPVSPVYGGPMLEAADAWCWDARPYPAFPARGDVWADADAWRAGHWLNGRLTGEASDLLEALLIRGGLAEADYVVEPMSGAAAGYVVDRPMRTRDALEPLLEALEATAAERDGRVALIGPQAEAEILDEDDLAIGDEGGSDVRVRDLAARPSRARVRFIDEAADYQVGSVVRAGEGRGGGLDRDLPMVCGRALAEATAARLLDEGGPNETRVVGLSPAAALRLEPGDVAMLPEEGGRWRVDRIDLDETPSARLSAERRGPVAAEEGPRPPPSQPPPVIGPPWGCVLDLPRLPGDPDERPRLAASGDPWRGAELHLGLNAETLSRRAMADVPCAVGQLTEPLGAGDAGRWDKANALTLRLEGPAPASLSDLAVLAGANLVAVEAADGRWEVLQFARAEAMSPGVWRLSRLLRGRQGTEAQARAGAPLNALAVMLDEAVVPVDLAPEERGLRLEARLAPRGAPAGGPMATRQDVLIEGRAAMAWSPAGLRAGRTDQGAMATWRARRPDHDGWDAPDPPRPGPYRVSLRRGGVLSRRWEVETAEAELTAADVEGPDAIELGVAEWREGSGWGEEARLTLRPFR